MSRDGGLELPWADGDYTFRLAWAELIKLQEAVDAGPFVVLERLGNGQWKVEEISHTIRLALVGGGTEPAKALRLVRDYVESRPPLENLMLARGILAVALHGPADETPGESEGEKTMEESMTSPTEKSE